MNNAAKEYRSFTENFDEVLKAEDDYIAARRKSIGLDDASIKREVEKIEKTQDVESENKWRFKGGRIGLALSGGGIRSATFNLGLLQALARQNLLRIFDYLSTVSGGGYIGACLSSLLANPEASVEFDKFPFRFQREVNADERQEVKWLRRHGKYLAPNTSLIGLDVWRLIGLYVSGFVLTNITTVYMVILLSYGLYLVVHSVSQPFDLAMQLFRYSFLVFIIMIAARWFATLRNLNYKSRQIRAYTQAVLALTATALSVFGGFIMLAIFLPELEQKTSGLVSQVLNGGAAASGGGLLMGLWKSKSKPVEKLKNMLFRAAWVAVLPILAAQFVRMLWTTNAFQLTFFDIPLLILLAAVLFILSLFTDTNRISMHHFYRDQLSKAYIIRRDEKNKSDEEEAIKSNEDLKVADLHSQKNGAPYHLINTTLNVPGSKDRYLRGRGADFFVFSRLYCGSDSTGYRLTKSYDKGETRLATAMAISGAAASPKMGEESGAVMTFIKTLLNIRLNRFMPNPDPARKAYFKFWPYYFLKELLGAGKENDWLLNLSDGGHYENLGIYQLIRRRCHIIVVSDAGADPDFNFGDFANLLRKIRIDLGVDIKIDLNAFRPDAVTKTSSSYFAVGSIEYPDAPAGLLVYLKSSIIGDEPEDILAYRRAHPTFPDEATTDQFFDEAQFESYRALGYLIGKRVFS